MADIRVIKIEDPTITVVKEDRIRVISVGTQGPPGPPSNIVYLAIKDVPLGTYTANLDTDGIVFCAMGDHTYINLPSAVGLRGRGVYVKRETDNVYMCQVLPQVGEDIDGFSQVDLIGQDLYLFISDGTNWMIG